MSTTLKSGSESGASSAEDGSRIDDMLISKVRKMGELLLKACKKNLKVDRDCEDPYHQLNNYDDELRVSSRVPGLLLCG